MKLRALCVFILCLFSFNAYSQDIWEDVDCSDLKWGSNNNVNIYTSALTYLHFLNENALTEENVKNNTITYQGIELRISKSFPGAWRMSFTITNLRNSPYQGYTVYDVNNQPVTYNSYVCWGFYVDVMNHDGGLHNWKKYYCNDHNQDRMWEWDEVNKWVIKGKNTTDAEKKILIEYDGYNKICVYDVTYQDARLLHTFNNAKEIVSIRPQAAHAANVVVKDFKFQRLIDYRYLNELIASADYKSSFSDYDGAIEEYTKAINYGRENYYVYFKRALAYMGRGYYRDYYSAIDDLTVALSYDQTQEAYFERGVAKMNVGDLSGVNDLKKCGPRGLVVLSKMNL